MKQDAATWKARTEEYVSADERRTFYDLSPTRSIWAFAHIWLGLAAAFAVIYLTYHYALPLHFALAPILIAYIGTRINAFAVQVHEGSHGLLFADKRLNDRFCNLAGAYWALNDVNAYWRMHRDHHAFLHEETDPDLSLYRLPDSRARSILRLLLEDATGITAARRIHQYLFQTRKTQSAPAASSIHAAGKLATLLAILTLFVALFGPWPGTLMFVAYWLVPLFCVFPVLIRIRIVAEHYSDLLHEDLPRLFISRTSVSNRIEEYLIGAQMQYHMEHHLFPKMPYYQLVRFHRLLWKRGFFESLGDESSQAITGGYIQFWKTLLTHAKKPSHASAPTA